MPIHLPLAFNFILPSFTHKSDFSVVSSSCPADWKTGDNRDNAMFFFHLSEPETRVGCSSYSLDSVMILCFIMIFLNQSILCVKELKTE